MEDKTFNIAFEFDDKRYKGFVNPSEKVNEDGLPASYHVVLNDVSFGYLSYNDCKWTTNEKRPTGIVSLVGKQIEKHYQL